MAQAAAESVTISDCPGFCAPLGKFRATTKLDVSDKWRRQQHGTVFSIIYSRNRAQLGLRTQRLEKAKRKRCWARNVWVSLRRRPSQGPQCALLAESFQRPHRLRI